MGDEIDNFEATMKELERRMAVTLQKAAVILQQEATADYRKLANPAPHRSPAPRGAFPAVRTGHLASSILIRPASVASIIKNGLTVRVGYRRDAFYGVALGNKGWKWLQDTLDRVRSKIQAAIGSTGRISGRGGIS